jgi:very-short-patch-repair endonuclease
MRADAEASVWRLAERQHGLITRAQARGAGLSPRAIDRRLATGGFITVHRRVYRVAGVPLSWEQRILAACLAAGPDAAASHVSAGVLWALIERVDAPVEVSVPYGRAPTPAGYTRHRSRAGLGRIRRVSGVPVTCPARTLADLAYAVPLDELEEALDAALRRRIVRLVEVRRWCLPGRAGAADLRRLVDVRDGRDTVPESVFETRFLRMLRAARLPDPVLQHEIRSSGRYVARVDLVYPEQRVAIELDGHRFHSGRKAFDRDRRRQNQILRAGYAVLVFTWTDLDDARATCEAVRSVLRERGHPRV